MVAGRKVEMKQKRANRPTVQAVVGHGKRVPCTSCGGDIHIDHFAGVVKTDIGPAFVCDKPECLQWIADHVPNAQHHAEAGRPIA